MASLLCWEDGVSCLVVIVDIIVEELEQTRGQVDSRSRTQKPIRRILGKEIEYH
jgi:hypothetical protein